MKWILTGWLKLLQVFVILISIPFILIYQAIKIIYKGGSK